MTEWQAYCLRLADMVGAVQEQLRAMSTSARPVSAGEASERKVPWEEATPEPEKWQPTPEWLRGQNTDALLPTTSDVRWSACADAWQTALNETATVRATFQRLEAERDLYRGLRTDEQTAKEQAQRSYIRLSGEIKAATRDRDAARSELTALQARCTLRDPDELRRIQGDIADIARTDMRGGPLSLITAARRCLLVDDATVGDLQNEAMGAARNWQAAIESSEQAEKERDNAWSELDSLRQDLFSTRESLRAVTKQRDEALAQRDGAYQRSATFDDILAELITLRRQRTEAEQVVADLRAITEAGVAVTLRHHDFATSGIITCEDGTWTPRGHANRPWTPADIAEAANAVCGEAPAESAVPEAPAECLPGCIGCRHQRGSKCFMYGIEHQQMSYCPVRQPVDDTPDAPAASDEPEWRVRSDAYLVTARARLYKDDLAEAVRALCHAIGAIADQLAKLGGAHDE